MNALHEFERRAAAALADPQLHGNLRRATQTSLDKRARRAEEIPDYEAWRQRAAEIRRESWERKDELLAEATERLEAGGCFVHRAHDAEEARRIVAALVADRKARRIVKSKSMLTEEIGLNAQLEAAGAEVLETDLGEFIIQLAGQAPSHITAPALHLNRAQVGELFADKLGAEMTHEPEELTALARRYLRERFLAAELGISGANFVVAETGSLVIVENEGNAGLTTTLPPVHVAVTGIEKIVPRLTDLDPLLRLLAPNGTGQRATSYVSILNGPAATGNGPGEVHVIFVDNGRRALARSSQREILACIRCGSCLNVCPIFRHAGGHAYGSVYPGPMGILLSPYLMAASTDGKPAGHRPANSLADVCSLCGACGEICPVMIPLPDLIIGARSEKESRAPWRRRSVWWVFGRVSARPDLFRAGGRALRWLLGRLPGTLARRGSSRWSRLRSLPEPPARSFRDEMRRRHPERIS